METDELVTNIKLRSKNYLKALRGYEPKAVTQLVFFLIFIMTIIGFNSNLNFNITLIILSSIYIAAIYLCLSLGLTMTYKLLKFANFAHAEYFLVGAYVGISFTFIRERISTNPFVQSYLPWLARLISPQPQVYDFIVVIVFAFIIAGIVAIIGDILIFEPLRRLNSSPETLMITSIGWALIVRNTIGIFFGGGFQYYRWISTQSITLPSFRLGGRQFISYASYGITLENIVTIIISLILVLGLFYVLFRTKTGKALRATSENLDLAEASGIDTRRMINITWFIGGGLAGVAGVLFSLTNAIFNNSGFLYLLPAFAIVVLGGIGSLKGSIYASLIVAFSQNISVSYLSWIEGPLQKSGLIAYQRVMPFAVLIFVILLKPKGLYGEELE